MRCCNNINNIYIMRHQTQLISFACKLQPSRLVSEWIWMWFVQRLDSNGVGGHSLLSMVNWQLFLRIKRLQLNENWLFRMKLNNCLGTKYEIWIRFTGTMAHPIGKTKRASGKIPNDECFKVDKRIDFRFVLFESSFNLWLAKQTERYMPYYLKS